MAKAAPSSQLSLFDTTALSSPFSLFGDGGGGLLPAAGGEDDEEESASAPLAPAIPRVVARDFRLTTERGLAAGWKARAADNLAAIRLMQRIEGETRPATAEEQAILARFVGYGAGDLANTLFRRPGDIHVHFFGTATLSFADDIATREGDVFEISADAFALPLRNPLQKAQAQDLKVAVL